MASTPSEEQQIEGLVILHDILHSDALRYLADKDPYRMKWRELLTSLEYMSFNTAMVLYHAIVAQVKRNNVTPLMVFVNFFMHPPPDVPNPYTNNRFLVSLNEILAQEARRKSEFPNIIRALLKIDSSILIFLMERTSGNARVVFGEYAQLKHLLPPLSCDNGRSVEDLYRMSVDRHYHTLATVFDWLVHGFPTSFDTTKVDRMVFSDMGTNEEKQNRRDVINKNTVAVRSALRISGSGSPQEVIDKLHSSIVGFTITKS
jgi:hypothetical protein